MNWENSPLYHKSLLHDHPTDIIDVAGISYLFYHGYCVNLSTMDHMKGGDMLTIMTSRIEDQSHFLHPPRIARDSSSLATSVPSNPIICHPHLFSPFQHERVVGVWGIRSQTTFLQSSKNLLVTIIHCSAKSVYEI